MTGAASLISPKALSRRPDPVPLPTIALRDVLALEKDQLDETPEKKRPAVRQWFKDHRIELLQQMMDRLEAAGVSAPREPDFLAYDLHLLNVSGGKDGQAMVDVLVPRLERLGIKDRAVLVHADLGPFSEWKGTRELVEYHAATYGLRLIVVRRLQGDLLAHVIDRGKWPGHATRYCTSDHKRGQILRVITRLANQVCAASRGLKEILCGNCEGKGDHVCPTCMGKGVVGAKKKQTCPECEGEKIVSCDWCHGKKVLPSWLPESLPAARIAEINAEARRLVEGAPIRVCNNESPVRLLNAMGLRGQESTKRLNDLHYERNDDATSGNRVVDNYLPIQDWTEQDVWARIRASGVKYHWAYDKGMPRLSCKFCFYASEEALMLSGSLNPDDLDEHCDVEELTGHDFTQDLSLREVRERIRRGEKIPERAADYSGAMG